MSPPTDAAAHIETVFQTPPRETRLQSCIRPELAGIAYWPPHLPRHVRSFDNSRSESWRANRRNWTSGCHSACNFGSDATLVQPWSYNAYQAGLKQVELGASVHLTLDQLELGDLALGLSVGPRRRDRGVDRSLVLDDAVGKRRD